MIWKKYRELKIMYDKLINENSVLERKLKEMINLNKSIIQTLKKNPARLKVDEDDVYATGFEYYSCECGKLLGHYNEIPHGKLCENCGKYIS